MKKLSELDEYRVPLKDCPEPWRYGGKGNDRGGAFAIPCGLFYMRCIASNGEGWDHVSVSVAGRTPTWAEMEYVKRMFFKPTEVAMQLHVPVDDHINIHPNVLHIWRPHHATIPLPPKIMV
jgi:hypothetical protein